MKSNALILSIAFAIDFLFGDPPNRFHPVAWMGNLLGWLQRSAPRQGDQEKFIMAQGSL